MQGLLSRSRAFGAVAPPAEHCKFAVLCTAGADGCHVVGGEVCGRVGWPPPSWAVVAVFGAVLGDCSCSSGPFSRGVGALLPLGLGAPLFELPCVLGAAVAVAYGAAVEAGSGGHSGYFRWTSCYP